MDETLSPILPVGAASSEEVILIASQATPTPAAVDTGDMPLSPPAVEETAPAVVAEPKPAKRPRGRPRKSAVAIAEEPAPIITDPVQAAVAAGLYNVKLPANPEKTVEADNPAAAYELYKRLTGIVSSKHKPTVYRVG